MITGINIYQNYYVDSVPHRQEEIEYCRAKNRVLNLTETPISYREITERMTYNQVFAMTEKYTDQLHIIANSDIFFEVFDLKNIVNLYAKHPNRDRMCFALTRWDVQPNGSIEFMNRADSQDVWIFYGAVPQIEGADFFVGGVAGCDNKIAYLLSLAGYYVVNPSIDIRTYHLHNSNIRNYIVNGKVKEQLPPPYRIVPPTTMREVMA
jgi:hypothetical protein